MVIKVSDEALGSIRLTPEQALLDFAIGLYTDGRVTMGRAAAVAGVSQSDFQRELGRREISVHYSPEDLHKDLDTLASLGRSE